MCSCDANRNCHSVLTTSNRVELHPACMLRCIPVLATSRTRRRITNIVATAGRTAKIWRIGRSAWRHKPRPGAAREATKAVVQIALGTRHPSLA